jgi:hypothetical protein
VGGEQSNCEDLLLVGVAGCGAEVKGAQSEARGLGWSDGVGGRSERVQGGHAGSLEEDAYEGVMARLSCGGS